MTNHYKAYDTAIKKCYASGLENIFLPIEFRKSIATSTKDYWKKSPNNYIGTQFSDVVNQNMDEIEIIYDQRLVQLRKMMLVWFRLYISIVNFIGKESYFKSIKSNKNQFVKLIESLDFNLEHKKQLLKFLLIKHQTFKSWIHIKNNACSLSKTGTCFQFFTRQVSYKETTMLEKYMSMKKYQHWSMASIWGKAFRNKDVSMSINTWYNNCRKLGISEKHKKPRKKCKKGSVKSTKPNETWHADVTYLKTIDNIQHYIYTILDNFSRKVIHHAVSTKLSGEMTMEVIKQAIHSQFNVDLQNQSIKLIVDGGSENNNKTVHKFIQDCQVSIDKKIALKDIIQSNSVIEGAFRTLKQTYLNDSEIHSSNIIEIVANSIEDYNQEKPHYIHKWYTPNEIYNNPQLKDVKPHNYTIKDRIIENKKFCCKDNFDLLVSK